MTENANNFNAETALVALRDACAFIVSNAAALWADATTNTVSLRRQDILRDKCRAVTGFFDYAKKHPLEISPLDVKGWQISLEARGLARTTIYCQLCHLSSFYSWAQRDPALGQHLTTNPVKLAHPKAPKPYQTESVKSLTDDEFSRLIFVVRSKAATGDVVGKRDYALLLFYVATGMRRSEVISLRGRDVEFQDGLMVLRSRVKGGDYVGREVSDPTIRSALLDYLSACGRNSALSSNAPLWTRHDYAGRPGAPLTSHAFTLNLKRYAKQAGISRIHLHQMRHTFARMVAEDSGSIVETQDALGHKNIATTRIYVQRIAIRRDRHSERILKRFESE
jgi:integrase